ncbi:MAG: hypothetical protein WC483_01205 [Candidatus Paceibacterota bacterium]
MITIVKRILTREITENVMLLADSASADIRKECEKALVQRLRGTPSQWGVMVDDHLKSLRLSPYASIVGYGTEIYLSVPVKASFEVVGYLRGDVLFNVSLAEKAADDSTISQFKRANIVGLPFQIEVKTKHDVAQMNIQIDDPRIEGSLQYIAVPAFYPHYAPLVAHLASERSQSLSLYAETEEPTLKSVSAEEMELIDPLSRWTPEKRRSRILDEIRRMLGLTPEFVGQGKKVGVVNLDAPFGGKSTHSSVVADATKPVVIEFIDVGEVERKYAVLDGHATFTFIRVPSLHPLSSIVAAVSWFAPLPRISQPPSRQQCMQFVSDVQALIKFHKLEVVANRSVYGSKETALRVEHLAAGKRLADGLAIEVSAPRKTDSERRAEKITAERKAIFERASAEGSPLHITPTATTTSRKPRK